MFALGPEGNVLKWYRVGGPYQPGGLPAIGEPWGEQEKGMLLPLFGRFGSGR